MKKILADIHNAVQNSRDIPAFLAQNSRYLWLHNTPISILHHASRVEDERLLETLNEASFFNAEGFSKEIYTAKELSTLEEIAPEALRRGYLICTTKKPTHFHFKAKNPKDKYKKIQDDDGVFEAFVTTSKFDQEATSKFIEMQLRDIMRSAKEITALKATAFVWIATLPKSIFIEDILKHYFGDSHIYVQKGRKVSYIAWSKTLSEINMRHFVNAP